MFYGISSSMVGLISSFVSDRQLCVVLDGTFSQEYQVNVEVPWGSIVGSTLFLLYINDLTDDLICDIAIYAGDTTLCSKCDQASDLWQQLALASELEADLQDTVDWDLLISMPEKLNWFHLTSLTLVLLMWKWMGLLLRKNHLLRCWSWFSLPN